MSEQTTINIIGWLVWFFMGAASLSATGRGLLDVMEDLNRDPSAKHYFVSVLGVAGLAAVMIFSWIITCLLWPWPLARFFMRRGLRNGHRARECPHGVLVREHEDKTRSIYRHGPCTRKKN